MAETVKSKAEAALKYAHQAEKLSLSPLAEGDDEANAATAVEAKFITPLDNVVETASGERLPGVPPDEALKFNELKHQMEGIDSDINVPTSPGKPSLQDQEQAHLIEERLDRVRKGKGVGKEPGNLGTALPPARTHPLFPPLPLYGPPTRLRTLQCLALKLSSFFLSLGFLLVIVLGSMFTSFPVLCRYIWYKLTFRDPDANRPLIAEERKRKEARSQAELTWANQHQKRKLSKSNSDARLDRAELGQRSENDYEPTEGGLDPIICDAGYYARRVGLDVEEFKVQTEDGFIISLWHVFDPEEYRPASAKSRSPHRPVVFPENHVESGRENGTSASQFRDGNRRYPVLMIHGLLQSAGAYCVNDDHSLAFYLAKSGYDVWLGNNRCGFEPQHTMLKYNDPRMWAWNIRQMGVMDLPALVSRVLSETGFEKLGLICHSQGTTQTFVALAKEQRPELGEKISVFCALAPAAYAGPLIGKMYFKFMRVISPNMFRVFFGIHAFIPFMMTMHRILPGKLYGFLGYRVFSFLFNWSDARWDRGLRARMFQFSPVYVSSESMRWWLGRECFAKQKCILSTRDEEQRADDADGDDSDEETTEGKDRGSSLDDQVREATGYEGSAQSDDGNGESSESSDEPIQNGNTTPGKSKTTSKKSEYAWYSKQAPPMALWIAGNDDLVDGKRLLRRFQRGREPHVRLVHAKIIPEYEHLDVIWAMDSIDQVGKEVKEVIWKTVSQEARELCRIPQECEEIKDFLA